MRLGTSLFSLTNEWKSRRYTLEQLVAKVAENELGPGLEIVGFQSLRSYPQLDDAEAAAFRELLEQHGLKPSCLGSNLDVALRADRLMTDDEQVEYLRTQIQAAHKLGFPVMRVQHLGSTSALERVLADAEAAQVKLGVEVHAPAYVGDAHLTPVLEAIDRLGSPYLGLIPDWSATMTQIPRVTLRKWQEDGLAPELAQVLEREWRRDGPPHVRFDAFAEEARAAGASELAINRTRLAFTMFGHADPQAWREAVPYVVHAHAKFYFVDQDLNDDAIPHEQLLSILAGGGYDGFISSEWEGSAFFEIDELDGFEMIRRHHALCRRILAQ